MDQTLWDTLSSVARVRADHPAVIFGDRTLSYAQLLDRASRAAAVLSRYFVVEEMPGWMHKIQRHRLREDAIARLGTDEFE